MNVRFFLLVISAILLLVPSFSANARSAGANGAVAGQCAINSEFASSKQPLVGLWQVTGYREINGYKSYTSPGDALLIAPTEIPGEVCVEFTLPVEGSQHFYLAVEADGLTIDETVYTSIGGELRIIIRAGAPGTASVVLYNRPVGGESQVEGGVDEGGAVVDVRDWS